MPVLFFTIIFHSALLFTKQIPLCTLSSLPPLLSLHLLSIAIAPERRCKSSALFSRIPLLPYIHSMLLGKMKMLSDLYIVLYFCCFNDIHIGIHIK